MEKSYIIKSKLKYTSKSNDKQLIDFDIKINSNHIMDENTLDEIEKYFVTNSTLRGYNKKEKDNQ